jgi:iron complex outermembrane receptor protein
MITLASGDKPSQDPFIQPGLNLGYRQRLSDHISGRISGGYKSRFPTLRELYGAALRRFLINPDLRPESALSADLGLEWSAAEGAVSATLFYQRVFNPIDQRNVDTLGSTRRQRVNLEGSRVPGVELKADYDLVRGLALSGDATFSMPRSLPADSVSAQRGSFLSEKPEVLAGVQVSFDRGEGPHARAELRYVGKSYSLDDSNRFVLLHPAATLNVRIGWRLVQPVAGIVVIDGWIRADNVFDATVLFQLGLPATGREVRAGIDVSL